MQAVESEFSGVLQSDGQRLEQLRCHTAQPGHILNRFAWGNTASLKSQPTAAGVDVRQGLLQYYRCCTGHCTSLRTRAWQACVSCVAPLTP